MKRTFNFLGAITILSLFMAACSGQTGRTDSRGDLADLREDMQKVIQTIDEAISTNDISEFKNKTEDAVSALDNRIDDYLSEMDNAMMRIDQNSRNHVIQMKQKKVEVEFKLALLEQDDYENWDDEGYQNNRKGTTGAATGTPTDQAIVAPRATPNQTTTNPALTTGAGTPNDDMTSRRETDRTQREVIYGPQLVDDLKDDLRDLRTEVEQFMQANLDSNE